MHRVLAMCLDAGMAGILMAPIFYLFHKRYFHNAKQTAWCFILAVYLAGVYAVVGLPDICYVRPDFNVNLRPFAYMFSDYRSSTLNVLLFMPLGLLLTVLWKPFRKVHWTVLFGFCTSLLIELLQLFTLRATDVNDLMTNTFGCLLGWCLGRLVLLLFPKIRQSEETEEIYLSCCLSFAIMFFLEPFLSNLLFDWIARIQ